MAAPTFDDWLDQRSTTYMRAPLSGGWFGVLLAVTGNVNQEVWLLASRFHLLDDPASPDDVLPLIAQDRRLPRYPLETADQHRQRLIDAWDIYPLGGTEYVIESQLRAAGFGPTNLIQTWGQAGHTWGQAGYAWADLGAFVEFRPYREGPRGEPPPYRTQFWITFSYGYHPLQYAMIPWGSFEWGDSEDGVWSYVGMTDDFVRTIMGIILKWKPSDHVFRGFRFRFGGITTWGQAGHTWGEAANTWGNAIEWDVPLGSTLPG